MLDSSGGRGDARGSAAVRTPNVEARLDPTLDARILRRVPMRYATGANPRLDRPAHVRAASGLAWVGARLAVLQDDANFLALVDPATGLADSITLPAGPGGLRQFDDGRGNKADKLDLEALARVPGANGPLLIALASGSTPHREWVALFEGVESGAPTARLHRAPSFYARLRDTALFAGSELNVEGLLHVGERLRLFGRGNGAARGEVAPVNASCEVAWASLLAHLERPAAAAPPELVNVVQYELGAIGGVRLAFTDVAPGWAGAERGATEGRLVLYAAAAEASPDATRDGEVAGSAIGVVRHRAGALSARWTPLRGEAGEPVALKVEGLVLGTAAPDQLFVVVDHDDHDRPSDLCEVRLAGPWWSRLAGRPDSIGDDG